MVVLIKVPICYESIFFVVTCKVLKYLLCRAKLNCFQILYSQKWTIVSYVSINSKIVIWCLIQHNRIG